MLILVSDYISGEMDMPFIKRKQPSVAEVTGFTKTHFKNSEEIDQAYINGLTVGDLVVVKNATGSDNYVVVAGASENLPPRLLLVGGENVHSAVSHEQIVTDNGLVMENTGTSFTFTTSKAPLDGELVFGVVRVLCTDGNSIDVLGAAVEGANITLPAADYADLVAAGAQSATVTYLVRNNAAPQSYFELPPQGE